MYVPLYMTIKGRVVYTSCTVAVYTFMLPVTPCKIRVTLMTPASQGMLPPTISDKTK